MTLLTPQNFLTDGAPQPSQVQPSQPQPSQRRSLLQLINHCNWSTIATGQPLQLRINYCTKHQPLQLSSYPIPLDPMRVSLKGAFYEGWSRHTEMHFAVLFHKYSRCPVPLLYIQISSVYFISFHRRGRRYILLYHERG